MSETAGQAAYEAMHASRERRDPAGGHLAWEQLDEFMSGDFDALKREDMEAAASAAIGHAAELAEPVTVAGVLCGDYPSLVAAMQAEIDRERTQRLHLAAGRDEARSDFSRLRAVLLEGGQSDAAVRRRCLAIIVTAGTPPVDVPLDVQRVHRPGSCQCTPCKTAAESQTPAPRAGQQETNQEGNQ